MKQDINQTESSVAQPTDTMPWAHTLLGPSAAWSGSLRVAVQMTLDASLPMFLIWGAERALVYNASFAEIAGHRHPGAFGNPVTNAWPELWSWDDNVFETAYPGAILNLQAKLSVAGDDSKWFDLSYTPVRDDDGRIGGVSCVAIDTTRRVHAEQSSNASAAADERLRIAHDAGGIGTFEWFPATNEMITSTTYRALWGIGADTEVTAPVLVNLVEPDDHWLLGTATEEKRSNPLAYAEFRIRRADTGERRWLARRGEVVGGGIGALRRFVGVAFDITERKLVEEALAATEKEVFERNEFIRLLLDSTEEGFYSVDRSGATTLCNRAFLRMLGFAHESEAIGRTLHDMIHHSHADGSHYSREHCPIYLAAQTGEAAHVEHEWFYRTDGSHFAVEYRAHPIWRDGQLQGALCTFIDITQRVDSVDQLRILNETLEHRVIDEIDRRARAEEALHQSQKMEAIGQLTGGVAHDFNNVLQIIGGNLQLLQNDIVENPTAQTRLDTAVTAVLRGTKLSSQLLAFARRQPLQPIVINLGQLVQNMNDLLRRALGESIEVETNVADQLWNTLADPSQIENVILNLAINSRDAMGGAGKLTIELGNVKLDDFYNDCSNEDEAVPSGEYVLLAVSDTGAGMSPDVLKKAFEPFFTTKPEGEGTGLGLSMAYGFVKQSQGHINIYSGVGQGTTIRIYLPRCLENASMLEESATEPMQGGSETILVVEDDTGVQVTVVDTLTTLGYRVLKANDGESALVILESGVPIDLLFTDVVMPGPLRSPDLARQARLLLPNLAVLFTSGYTQNAIVHGGRLDAGVDLLSKPYRRDELARKIRRSLAKQLQITNSRPPVPSPTAPTARTAPITPITPVPSLGVSSPAPVAAPAPAPAPAPDAGASLRILVVEDNIDLCQLVCELLENFGHLPTPSGSAEEALTCIAADTFDILLTDVRLPGMSGIDLARRVVAEKPGIQVIFASGYGAGLTANVGFPAHSLAKPYDINQLQTLLESLRT
ncbi:MAG: PAS domain S-box protein [Herminiimonas sp.]|nr:PAS domain S-box protein [Herminiimonas sp.]